MTVSASCWPAEGSGGGGGGGQRDEGGCSTTRTQKMGPGRAGAPVAGQCRVTGVRAWQQAQQVHVRA